MLTLTEENYIKSIFHLGGVAEDTVSTKSISESLNVKAASVTDMLKRLGENKFVVYEKSRGAKLTDKGIKNALLIIRKHRLWETFPEKLKFSWDEVHEVAEQLEHVHSELLVEKLDAFLNYPKFDPHGDPIPDSNGKMADTKAIALTQGRLGESYKIVMVKDGSPAFLKYVNKIGLSLGDMVTVKDIEEYDGSMKIQLSNKK